MEENKNELIELEEINNDDFEEDFEEGGSTGLGVLIGATLGIAGTLLTKKVYSIIKDRKKKKDDELEADVVDLKEAQDAVEVESEDVTEKKETNKSNRKTNKK